MIYYIYKILVMIIMYDVKFAPGFESCSSFFIPGVVSAIIHGFARILCLTQPAIVVSYTF
jgi:hypothetical protein